MKKFIAFFVCAAMCMSMLPFGNIVGASGDGALLVNESFNDYVTNEQPDGLGISAKNYYISAYKPGDKGLCVSASSKGSTVSFDAPVTGDFVISFDILSDGLFSGGLAVSDTYKKSQSFLEFNKNGTILSHNGKELCGYSASNTVKVAVAVKPTDGKYSVFVNGTAVLKNWTMKTIAIKNMSSFVFTFKGTDVRVLLDNINAHAGSAPKSAYPVSAYNPEETELVLADDEITVGSKVITNLDFDKNKTGYNPNIKDNILEIRTEKDHPDNHVLYMEKTNNEDHYFDINISEGASYPMLVFSTDIRLLDATGTISFSAFKDTTGAFCNNVQIINGKLMAGQNMLANLSSDKWYNVAIVVNFAEAMFDVYVNSNKVAEEIPLANAAFGTIAVSRFTFAKGDSTTTCEIDNFLIYEGKEPRDFTEEDFKVDTNKSVMPNDQKEEVLMADKVGLHLRSGVLTVKGKKILLDPAPYVKNDRTLIPVRAVSEAFGVNVDWDETTQTVSIGEDTQIVIDKDTIKTHGKDIRLDVPAEIKDGRTFIPFRALCEEVLEKKVYYDDSVSYNSGMIVITDNEFTPPKGDALQALDNYLFYYRPKNVEIEQDFKENNPNNEHPRILFRQSDIDQLKGELETSDIKQDWYKSLLAAADSLLNQPCQTYHFEQGERLLAVSRSVLSRTKTLGMAYLLTKDKKYADRCYEELYTVCKVFPDWHPDHYLDVGEMTAAVAIGYDWCYSAFTDEQRKAIEEGMFEYGLGESLKWQYGQKGYPTRWCLGNNNWNVVCNGGVAMGALAFMDVYPDECGKLVMNNIRGLEAMMFHFAPDGAWFEGPAYWSYAMQYVSMMFASLKSALGTDYSLIHCQGLDLTANYILQMQSNYGTFNFADSAVGKVYSETLYWLSNIYHSDGAASAMLNRTNNSYPGVLGLVWYNPEIKADEINLPLDQYFRDAEAVAMRESWTMPQATYAAYHGGEEVREHSHLDAGGFVFDSMGERWAEDLGTDDYTLPGYFDTNGARFNIFRMRAQSHNTVVINPDSSPFDHNAKAVNFVEKLESKPKGAISVLDMTQALQDHASAAKRGFFLTDNRKSLVVRDEIQMKDAGDVYWFLYTKALSADINGNNVVLTSVAGNKMKLDFAFSKNAEITFEDAKALPGTPTVAGENENKGIYRVKVKIPSATGKVTITAKLTPENVPQTDVSQYDKSIDSWTIPDGEIVAPPKLSAIYVNGEMLSGFDAGVTTYKYTYFESDKTIPEFTATTEENATVLINNTPDKKAAATVKVSSNEDSLLYTIYTINFVEQPDPVDLNGYTVCPMKAVTAVSEPQPENPKESSFDGDLTTRWSAEGKNDIWIQYDLGSVTTIDSLFMATYMGSARSLIFKILVSEDGVTYKQVYDGQTGGMTDELEEFSFAPINARYVKVSCYGTTAGTWNSISEVVIAKEK